MGKETRVFGGKDDHKFWSDKPIVRGHPKFKEKWYHIHWFNIPYDIIHKSKDGKIREIMGTNYKCRCGKIKN